MALTKLIAQPNDRHVGPSQCAKSLREILTIISLVIQHTFAFKTLKDQAQEIFDFAVMVCCATPYLKHGISLERKDYVGTNFEGEMVPFRPDHFSQKGVYMGKLIDSSQKYKKEVAKTIRLSSFSYFEAYVGDIIREIFEFHGGQSILSTMTLDQNMDVLTSDQSSARSKLKERPKKSWTQRYQKLFSKLDPAKVNFPHHFLMKIGMETMQRRATSYKASQIPEMLSDLLGFELSATELGQFYEIREARNRIAHGRAVPGDTVLSTAIDANFNLRQLALRIDSHVLKYWMVIDPVSLPFATM